MRILDGNCLAATDHRLEVLRPYAAKALPGKSLVILEPARQLATHVFPARDGYTQERALFADVLKTVEPGDLWIADRNMGTLKFLFALHEAQADVVIRQHGTPDWQALGDLEEKGPMPTGMVVEAGLSWYDLHEAQADVVIRQHGTPDWQALGDLEEKGPMPTGIVVEAGLSWYDLVEQVQATYRGMTIAIEPEYWQPWQAYSRTQLAQHLLDLAARVDLKMLLKQPRAPKRKKPPLIVDRRRRHLSTHRLLDQQATSP